VYKNNYVKRISESFNVQFRAEVFNILNHANFAVPIAPDNTDIIHAWGSADWRRFTDIDNYDGNGDPVRTEDHLASIIEA